VILAHASAGEAMAVTPSLPEDLGNLIKRMVAIVPANRPPLREVYTELLLLHRTYTAEWRCATYLQPVWGIPTRYLPPSPTSCLGPSEGEVIPVTGAHPTCPDASNIPKALNSTFL
jgi:hypothetical protein